MATGAANLLEVFAKIPKDKIEAIYQVAKSAKARKADDGDASDGGADGEGLTENAQNALKAAGRILAPYAEELSPPVMGALADAIGIEGAEDVDVDDALGDATDATEVATGDVGGDLQEAATDADAAKADGGTEDNTQGQDENVAAAKEEGDAEPNITAEEDDAAKNDDGSDNSVDGNDVIGKDDLGDAMPDFSDASDADKEAALAAARTAFAAAMRDRGVTAKAAKADAEGDKPPFQSADAKNEAEAKAKRKSAAGVAKSAAQKLTGFTEGQRKDLEMVFKSHIDKMAELEEAHKVAVAKSAKLERQLVRKSFVEEAAQSFSALGSPEEIGGLMLRMHDKDPDAVADLKTVLKAANAQALAGGEAGLFSELGTMRGNSGGTSADAKIQAYVDSVVEKSGDNRTRAQIEAAFLATPAGRALYAESRRETDRAKGGR